MTELVLIANAGDGTISVLALHRDPDPRLELLATSGDVPGCSTFAVDADRDLVFAAYKGEPAGVATLRLNRATGELTELARRDVEAGMNYLSLSDDRRSLLGVSYGGGVGMVWPVDGEALGEPHSRFTHRNLHAIVQAEGTVYAPALGDDLIAQFSIDASGALTPLDPPTVPAPAGSGPRHLVVRDGNVYVLTEFSGEVIRYTRGPDGGLVEAQGAFVVDPAAGLAPSRFGADPREEHLIWGADIHLAGDVLLTSERMSSMLTTTQVQGDGSLGPVLGHTPTEDQPRGFATSADGVFAVAVGERSTDASLLAVEADGALRQLGRVGIGRGANWVRFV